MLSFVQNLFAPKRPSPIGVDFGTDGLRMAQVQVVENEPRLVAAASADVPSHVRKDMTQRLAWFTETARDLLAQGQFRGRQAVLSLPAAVMHIQHLRMVKLDEEAMKKALPWELQGKLPIDPSQALLRHLVAGEVYQDQEQKNEVIVLAAGRELINQFLAAAARARLDVVGMNVEPQVLADCFCHIHRRKANAEAINFFVDIGSAGTRAVIVRGRQILFARSIPIGGDHFTQAAASALEVAFEDAKLLRIKLCHVNPASDEKRRKPGASVDPASLEQAFPLLGTALSAQQAATSAEVAPDRRRQALAVLEPMNEVDPEELATGSMPELSRQAEAIEEACSQPLERLIEELNLCRRYHEATFPNSPVERLTFVGGEARQRGLCQRIARQMSLAAQIGDPLVRMARQTEVGIESGIDRRQPQPGWSVAVGLSMGPAGG